MKITFFGLTISSSWGNGHATPYRALLRALHRLGHEIHFFEKDAPYYRARRDFSSCDYCALTLYQDWAQARASALAVARESDVVVTASYLPEGRRICDEVLDLPRPLRVFYDLDTPITLKNMEENGVEYLRRDQIPAFDLVLSFTGGGILSELEQKHGARLARPLYGCIDPDLYRRTEPHPRFACDLSYMGTYAPDRQMRLEELFLEPARRCPKKQFLLAGSLYPWSPYPWSEHPEDREWPENVRRLEHVAPELHPQFYSSSRATLNITREEMARSGWCPSGRFFEAAACGAPLITDGWEGLDWFFDTRRDLRVVSSTEQVRQALNTPGAELAAMAESARQRTLQEHTGTVRARQMLQHLEEAASGTAIRRAEMGEVA